LAVHRPNPVVRSGDVAKDEQKPRPPETRGVFAERHYTVIEIAEMWSLSKDAVRRLFAKEPGVVVLGSTHTRGGKRRYRTLRIPESVVERVHKRSSLVS
jgi:hypothetical protein